MRGWAGYADAHIQADPYFARLRHRNVHFYDDTAGISPVFHVKPQALQQFNLDPSVFFDLEEVDDLIEYEEGDGGYEGVVIADNDKEDDDF